MKIGRVGLILLGVWLILQGVLRFVSIPFLTGDIMAVLAIVTGIILLIGK
ncbi:MAG: hypothetical protein ACOX2G_10360 [Bacillota bacterium]|jgi:hypothetical protein